MKKIDKTFLRWAIGIAIGSLIVWVGYELCVAMNEFLLDIVWPFTFIPTLISFEMILFFVKFLKSSKRELWRWFIKIPEIICSLYNCYAIFCILILQHTRDIKKIFPTVKESDIDRLVMDDVVILWLYSSILLVVCLLIEGIIWYLNRRKKKKKEVAESEETTI